MHLSNKMIALVAVALGAAAGVAFLPSALKSPAPAHASGGLYSSLAPPGLSGILPTSVPLPDDNSATAQDLRPFFDTFSWQSFVALNWPAVSAGVPDQPNTPSVFTSPPDGSSPVWETYAESYTLFGTGDAAPPDWGDFGTAGDPCNSDSKTLRAVAKGTDTLTDVNEAFSFPLIDQNKNYVYAEVRFNQAYYDFVAGNQFYLQKPLSDAPKPISMPWSEPPATPGTQGEIGALMIKAAWRKMEASDDQSRYHVVNATIAAPQADGSVICTDQPMGLVGFHIAQKLEAFPQWIWSSFEQVDNVERGRGSTDSTPISFNNGTDTPATPGGWANRPTLVPPLVAKDERTPTQVTRYNAIPTTPAGHSTVDLNTAWQDIMVGTPFEFYQLIITQWPTEPFSNGSTGDPLPIPAAGGVYPRDSGQPFPVDGATNTAMETFVQSPQDATGLEGNSCMQCHYGTAATDFSWILSSKSHP